VARRRAPRRSYRRPVAELYDLLAELTVRAWDLRDPLAVNRLGTLPRFNALLADYESVRRRARPDAATPG
jgi:DNA helicase-2/ATP-dependent DNA helicase PcrA